MDGLNSEIRKQARFIDSRKEVIPLEKSVLIQYCDMQAETKELLLNLKPLNRTITIGVLEFQR